MNSLRVSPVLQYKMPTPVNVFTGFLGAGKSTCILNLIQQLNERALVQNSNIVWLKNEFGENAVDSVLAKEKSIAVKEILNGCLCCTLVGKLSDAIKEIVETMHPDRIIIETSGSAYPAPGNQFCGHMNFFVTRIFRSSFMG